MIINRKLLAKNHVQEMDIQHLDVDKICILLVGIDIPCPLMIHTS
jgi:hypothetical protein